VFQQSEYNGIRAIYSDPHQYTIFVCKLPLHTSHTYFKLQDCTLLVFLEHFCHMRLYFFWDMTLCHIPEEQNPQLRHYNNLKTCVSVTHPSTYQLSFHFKLEHFKFAQFMVLNSCASKTNYF